MTPISSDPVRSPQVEHQVLLHHVTWETFARLLADLEPTRGARLAYCQGDLEIMSPQGNTHERIKKHMARLIEAWTLVQGIEVIGLGSWTLLRADLAQGIEPDECFYIEHEPMIRSLEEISLTGDPERQLPPAPPPDLALEVDITSSSVTRMRIYQALAVPEIWRYTRGGVTVHRSHTSGYVQQQHSTALPGFPTNRITELYDLSLQIGQTQMIRRFMREIQ